MNEKEIFMHRALALAQIGRGSVAPNPMVGCVIVLDNQIIGEGWHQKYGAAHAEVNAVRAVKDKTKIKDATVYVSLEPCTHFGKTPPCVDLLIAHQPQKVVICNLDPNPLISKSIEKMQNAGILVETGVLEKEGREINKRFFTFQEKKRPYIILKWAETADGFIARENFDSKWISNSLSRKLVHKWRSEESAILVGTNTTFYDNPQLNVRDWKGANPLRIVIDKSLRLSQDLHIFDQSQATICYNLIKNEEKENLVFVKIAPDNFLENILTDLYERKIQSVLVEGGSQLLQSLIENKLWDEARIFKNLQTFGKGIFAPKITGKLVLTENILDDTYFEWQNV